MKILFILTETLRKGKGDIKKYPLATQEDIHLGISYISSILEQNGHQTDIFIKTNLDSYFDLEEVLQTFQPDIVGFSTVYREFYQTDKIAAYIKSKYPNLFLFAGGTHVTLNPEEVIAQNFDAICIGEGEYPVLELVEMMSQNKVPTGIKNFWFKTDNGIEINETREYIGNLDALPFPNRKMWQKYIKDKNGIHVVLVGRGCPFNCTYCCNHALRKTATGNYTRFRSPENIAQEIEMLVNEFPGLHTIFLEAEALNLNPEFLEALADRLSLLNKTLPRLIAYGANIRMHNNMNIQHVINQFVKANIVVINIGLESGSERVRKEILCRPEYTNEELLKAVKLAKKAHRHIMLFTLLGIPGETVIECKETLEMVKKCRPSFIHLGIFTPYPGTALYDQCVKNGLIDPVHYKELGRHRATFNTPHMTKRQIEKEYYSFFPRVYAKNMREYIILRALFYLIYRWNWVFLRPYGLKNL